MRNSKCHTHSINLDNPRHIDKSLGEACGEHTRRFFLRPRLSTYVLFLSTYQTLKSLSQDIELHCFRPKKLINQFHGTIFKYPLKNRKTSGFLFLGNIERDLRHEMR